MTPNSATVFNGRVRGGSIASITASDQATVNLESTSGVVAWYSMFSNIPLAPSSLRVTYEGSSSAPCTQSLWIWSWTRGVWVALDARSATATDSVTTVTVPNGVTEFVTSSSNGGAVAVLAACVRTNATFTTSTDLWQVSYS